MSKNTFTEILDDIRHNVVEKPTYGEGVTRDHSPTYEEPKTGEPAENWFSHEGWEPPEQTQELEKEKDRESEIEEQEPER